MTQSAAAKQGLKPHFNLPNFLTATRFIFAGVFVFAFLSTNDAPLWMPIALVASALAMVSDWADGYLARRMGTGSDFGKLFDPLADAFFFVAAFVVMGAVEVYPLWLAAPFVVRELLQHIYIRPTALRRGVALGAKRIGKIKTAVQSGIVLVICALQWGLASPSLLGGVPNASVSWWIASLGVGLAGALSLASILPYLRTLRDLSKA